MRFVKLRYLLSYEEHLGVEMAALRPKNVVFLKEFI